MLMVKITKKDFDKLREHARYKKRYFKLAKLVKKQNKILKKYNKQFTLKELKND